MILNKPVFRNYGGKQSRAGHVAASCQTAHFLSQDNRFLIILSLAQEWQCLLVFVKGRSASGRIDFPGILLNHSSLGISICFGSIIFSLVKTAGNERALSFNLAEGHIISKRLSGDQYSQARLTKNSKNIHPFCPFTFFLEM